MERDAFEMLRGWHAAASGLTRYFAEGPAWLRGFDLWVDTHGGR